MYCFILQADSPCRSNLDALGIYILCALCFVFGSLVEFAIVMILSQRSMSDAKIGSSKTMSNKTHHNDPACRSVALRFRSKTDPSGREQYKDTMNGAKTKTNLKTNLPFYMVIDVVAFWLYLFLYLIFNLTYWTKYGLK